MEAQRPFRPRSANVVSPYDVVPRDVQRRLHAPAIGLDGGVLIPHAVVSQELQQGTLLGEFLAHRTMQTGEFVAASHDEEGVVTAHFAESGSWDTSRRMTKYYGVNYGSGPADKHVRSERLRTNLETDAEMLSHWPEVTSRITRYDPETQWRLYAGILQIFSNDWIGLDYAYRVASHYNSELAQDSRLISETVFEAVTQYYRLLANPTMVEEGPVTITDPRNYLTSAANALQKLQSKDLSTADSIRNRSETDHSFLTLAAAKTFMNEFANRDNPPAVVIPLLGGYHLGPALAALGYQGEIIPVVTGHKVMEGSKRRDTDLPLSEGLTEHLKDRDFVIFEDTFLTGGTLAYLTGEFRKAGLEPLALRTMFMGDNLPNPEKFPPNLQAMFAAYYATPSGRMVSRGDSMGATIQKRTTRMWAQQSEVVGE